MAGRGSTRVWVFPARAGMILADVNFARFDCRIPRESGDDPEKQVWLSNVLPYSPRERG